ncbi:MAG: hypothetical protein LBP59_03170 [Planctomycetaceae bacterium]|jgi:hypothetical protein|nr:hypothetical protein [Planctomycetaceae bacterium]
MKEKNFNLIIKFIKYFITCGIAWFTALFIMLAGVSIGLSVFIANMIADTIVVVIFVIFIVSSKQIFDAKTEFFVAKSIIYCGFIVIMMITNSYFIDMFSHWMWFINFATLVHIKTEALAKVSVVPPSLTTQFVFSYLLFEKIDFKFMLKKSSAIEKR